jgi:hypothetical protein
MMENEGTHRPKNLIQNSSLKAAGFFSQNMKIYLNKILQNLRVSYRLGPNVVKLSAAVIYECS